MVDLVTLDEADTREVRDMIERHVRFTQSALGQRILDHWLETAPKFVKVFPRDYRRMLESLDRARQSGLSEEDAVMEAFIENRSDPARVSGN